MERLTGSQPYLEFLLDRAAAGLDLSRPDSRKTVSGRDADGRGDDSGRGRARSVRRSAGAQGARSPSASSGTRSGRRRRRSRREAPAVAVPPTARCGRPSRGCCGRWCIGRSEGLAAVGAARAGGPGGAAWRRRCFRLAASLADMPPDVLPGLLRERLSEGERALLDRAAAAGGAGGGGQPSASSRSSALRVDAGAGGGAGRNRSAAGTRSRDRRRHAGDALWRRKKALTQRSSRT